eukprot:9036728-Pyramimonas_sp.AAC.1
MSTSPSASASDGTPPPTSTSSASAPAGGAGRRAGQSTGPMARSRVHALWGDAHLATATVPCAIRQNTRV